MIELKNVSYVYGSGTSSEKKALRDVNLTIDNGEFIGIVGHTGSGKSTLIAHLNGLLKASMGEILYDGDCIYDKKYSLKTLRGKVGLVFQYPEYQLFEATVFEDVCFGPKNLGFEKKDIIDSAKKALEQVGVEKDLYDKSPFELSGGQKRRVAIAGILAMNPEVLVLDEPTAGLDPFGKNELLTMLKDINEKNNTTIVLVSHSMEDVAEYVDRMIVMEDGKVLYDDIPKEVFKNKEKLESIGLGIPEVTKVVDDLRKRGYDIDDNPITLEQATKCIFELVNN